MNLKKIIIFGGSGFIGGHFIDFLIKKGCEKIYVADIVENKNLSKLSEVTYINCDVRKKIDIELLENIDAIFNFAAIHREPGHEGFEYFETNINGAKNICNFAHKQNCKTILFTSSISPYGPSEDEKNEHSLPTPETPYGISKLTAELIHQNWQTSSNLNKLVIVRPGVVFGPNENGNMSRLIKAVKNNYFVFTGNKQTLKAGIYVKELCRMFDWSLEKVSDSHLIIFNASFHPNPKINDYVNIICSLFKKNNRFISLPKTFLLYASFFLTFLLKIFLIKNPFHPVRVKKLFRSNNIKPSYLLENGYEFKYDLESALDDWKKNMESEW